MKYLFLVLILASCTEVITKNSDHIRIIARKGGEQSAFTQATEHCAKYSKKPVPTLIEGKTTIYNCVEMR